MSIWSHPMIEKHDTDCKAHTQVTQQSWFKKGFFQVHSERVCQMPRTPMLAVCQWNFGRQSCLLLVVGQLSLLKLIWAWPEIPPKKKLIKLRNHVMWFSLCFPPVFSLMFSLMNSPVFPLWNFRSPDLLLSMMLKRLKRAAPLRPERLSSSFDAIAAEFKAANVRWPSEAMPITSPLWPVGNPRGLAPAVRWSEMIQVVMTEVGRVSVWWYPWSIHFLNILTWIGDLDNDTFCSTGHEESDWVVTMITTNHVHVTTHCHSLF